MYNVVSKTCFHNSFALFFSPTCHMYFNNLFFVQNLDGHRVKRQPGDQKLDFFVTFGTFPTALVILQPDRDNHLLVKINVGVKGGQRK